MMRIYYFLAVLVNPLALLTFGCINATLRPRRAKVVVMNPAGELLLVVNAIGDRNWTLPGGGMKRREEPAAAAARELREELGVDIAPVALKSLGTTQVQGYPASLFYTVLSAAQLQMLHIEKFEIYRSYWCAPHSLPSPVQPLVREAVARLFELPEIDRINKVTFSSVE